MKIVVVLAAFSILTGCHTAKVASSSTRRVTTKSDSASKDSVSLVQVSDTFSHKLESKDTAIGIAGKDIGVKVDIRGNNNEIPTIDTTIQDGSLSLHLYTDREGKLNARCKADSLTIVIKGLIRENSILTSRINSMVQTGTTSNHNYRETTLKEVVTEENKSWWAQFKTWINYLIAMVFGALIWEILKRFQKYLKLCQWWR